MKTKKNKIQQGFTLIELMIVVAIIGILASIALPAYQDYIIRAKITPILTKMSSFKAQIEEFYQVKNLTKSGCSLRNLGGQHDGGVASQGSCPNAGNIPWFPEKDEPYWDKFKTESYIKEFYIGASYIMVRLNGGDGTGLPAVFQDAYILLAPHYSNPTTHNGDLEWRCGSHLVPVKYLPSSCRYTVATGLLREAGW